MYSRNHPYLSYIKERFLLTTSESSKKTYHISLEIKNPFSFKVGDSIAIIPTNDPQVIDEILYHLKASGEEEISDARANRTTTFRNYLLHKANISKVSFHKLFPVEKTSLPLIELVKHHRPTPSQLCQILLPLMPRFYSIASSPKVFPDEVHLTVALTHFCVDGQIHFGVASHFLSQLAEIGNTPIPIYNQPSHDFTLPQDPNTPIIMIGPGTGIAPFRAFVQERIATQAEGKNWLIFGERNRKSDFYYKDYWLELENQGRLRLDTAFSRDQPEKIYVQHKMLEHKKAIWQWIEEGSYIYVCGDAQQMAKDVDAALQQIIHLEGGMIEEDARRFLKQLRSSKRYLLDVY